MRSTSRTHRAAIAAIALGFSITACSSGSGDSTANPAPRASAAPEANTTPSVDGPASGGSVASTPGALSDSDTGAVPEALRFTAPLIGGGEFDGAAIADRPTVFWFWAPT